MSQDDLTTINQEALEKAVKEFSDIKGRLSPIEAKPARELTFGEKLESSIIIAAVIACNKCKRVDVNEEFQNDIPYAAQLFYEDGWRVVNEVALCPDCLEQIKLES